MTELLSYMVGDDARTNWILSVLETKKKKPQKLLVWVSVEF